MTIVVFDNRSTQDTLKASMTTRLINTLGGETIDVITEGPLPEGTTFLVLSGSSRCISEGEVHLPAVEVVYEAMEQKIPVLGICYGFQILAHVHGYSVERLPEKVREHRHVEGIGKVRFHHKDCVVGLPHMYSFSDTVYGVQFHPESTPEGVEWLRKHIFTSSQQKK